MRRAGGDAGTRRVRIRPLQNWQSEFLTPPQVSKDERPPTPTALPAGQPGQAGTDDQPDGFRRLSSVEPGIGGSVARWGPRDSTSKRRRHPLGFVRVEPRSALTVSPPSPGRCRPPGDDRCRVHGVGDVPQVGGIGSGRPPRTATLSPGPSPWATWELTPMS